MDSVQPTQGLRAEVVWGFGEHFAYLLESGEALIFSSPSYGGDGSWAWVHSHESAFTLVSDGLVRDKGEVEIDSSFFEQVRATIGRFQPTPSTRYYREDGYLGQEEHQAEMMRVIRETIRDNETK